jgi:hypothetical protein
MKNTTLALISLASLATVNLFPGRTITLISNDSKEFVVNKALLKECKVLQGIIEEKNLRDDGLFYLTPLDRTTLDACLVFLQTGMLTAEASPKHLADLLTAADYLEIPSLMNSVVAALTRQVDSATLKRLLDNTAPIFSDEEKIAPL